MGSLLVNMLSNKQKPLNSIKGSEGLARLVL